MNMERSQFGLDKIQVQLTTLKKQSDVRLSEMKKQAKKDATMSDGEAQEVGTPEEVEIVVEQPQVNQATEFIESKIKQFDEKFNKVNQKFD